MSFKGYSRCRLISVLILYLIVTQNEALFVYMAVYQLVETVKLYY